MYDKVKSKFIRKKLGQCSWKNRSYIDDLITIEKFVLGERFGWVTGYIMHGLHGKYPKEYETIYRELKPKEFKELLKCERKEKERERKENEEFEKQEWKEVAELKKEWAKAGGRI